MEVPSADRSSQSTVPSDNNSATDDWIRIENVSLIRSGKRILDQIDWTVSPGGHWTVLGANGSGKTSLLQLLAGYLWPTRGRITVLGKRFGQTDLRELRKSIGWVGSFLQAQVPSNQKPLDFIVSGKFASIGIFETPTPEDYALAREIAERLKCETVLDRPYGVLSQGEKQRLLIARAMIHRPRLLILDEPSAGLDLLAREQLLHTLEALGRSKDAPTLIFVTHHLDEIMPVFSHVLVLKNGRVLAQGTKGEVLKTETLSSAFGIPLEVSRAGTRYWVRMEGRHTCL
jgi:iron complex transport system ATP-binding protein